MKLKIEIPRQCRYIRLDQNGVWTNPKSSLNAERIIRGNNLEIVSEEVFGDVYIVHISHQKETWYKILKLFQCGLDTEICLHSWQNFVMEDMKAS